MNIDTSDSCVSKSQFPPRPYLSSNASNNEGILCFCFILLYHHTTESVFVATEIGHSDFIQMHKSANKSKK